MKTRALASLLCLAACGPTEVNEEPTLEQPKVGVLRQAGKTDQGKTDQGKTDQGKTDQGNNTTNTRLVINRGGWLIRQGSTSTYASGYGELVIEGFGLPGTRLQARNSSGVALPVSTTTYRYDQDGSWRWDVLKGYVQNGQPLAYLNAQEMYSNGYPGPMRQMRIVNTYPDNGPYNTPTSWDSSNMLSAAYKTQLGLDPTYPNRDLQFYKVQIKNATDPYRWDDLCQSSGPGNKALFMKGYFDTTGRFVENSQYLGVTCWDGTAAKCMRWGYRPWQRLTHPTSGSQALEPLWLACVRAAKADYCGNGTSFTDDARQIDIWDRYGFIAKTPESDQWTDANGRAEAFSDEAAFDRNGAVCLVRERLYTEDFTAAACPLISTFVSGGEYCVEPSPTGDGTWSSCGPKGTVTSPTNIFDRGSIYSCDWVATRPPLVYVASYDSGCSSHSPTGTGRALGADCNCLTKTICGNTGAYPAGGHPWKECCAEDSEGHLMANKWDSQCAQRAIEILSSPNAGLCQPTGFQQ